MNIDADVREPAPRAGSGWLLLLGVLFLAAPRPGEAQSEGVDKRSFDLGMIQAFSEVVGAGVKRLALSPPLLPGEADALIVKAEEIARKNGVSLYRETEFLTTDLFPESVTDGKHVLLIYLDPAVKSEYMALKADKQRLIAAGEYEGPERTEIARKLGRLLSYREDQIAKRLARERR